MPGELKPGAVCPKCGDPLLALVDTSSTAGVKREYYHDRWPGASPKGRRKRRCVRYFTDHAAAARERRRLEI